MDAEEDTVVNLSSNALSYSRVRFFKNTDVSWAMCITPNTVFNCFVVITQVSRHQIKNVDYSSTFLNPEMDKALPKIGDALPLLGRTWWSDVLSYLERSTKRQADWPTIQTLLPPSIT